MPQTFQVLRCYKCSIFQIHQTKKSSKWECKLCGEKQSIKRHYGIGTGKDCRIHVQKLNKMQAENTKIQSYGSGSDDSETDECLPAVNKIICKKTESRWSNYIHSDEEVTKADDPMYSQDLEVDLEKPKKTNFKKSKPQSYEHYQHNISSKVNDVCGVVQLSNTPLSNKNKICEDDEDENKFQYRNISENILTKSTENINSNNISSYKCEPNKLQTSSKQKNREFQAKIKKSKWDQFIENEQHKTNDLCETDDMNSNRLQTTVKTESSKQLHKRSFNQDSSSHPIVNKPSKSAIKETSIFSMSDDGDLDNILNF